ncbi:MAG: ethanolamine ammonia-lyase reactivating factor EutA [Deltaproteobacteria bacterium]|nr:ethanolamine ammonia-lyase reactivating factor EutA [Deltaproteobacteria bacterium]MDZ4342994.1 ethanolamine ammonia-lyase reactivating factor EutA [Candidatus Binatia bacterium]
MHDDIYDHDHPDNFIIKEGEIVTDIEGLEMFSLKSVGIDIGSSTSHLIFSHITLRRQGASLSGKFKVTNREVLYRSPIMLTPYLSPTKIDTDKVNEFIHEAYRDAGLTPEDIDTGAVIITGEALKKQNAQPIVENFAKYSGKFICAAAGHNHEALLAAYGCGAVDLSKTEHKTVLNVDMGGGTTKLSLIEDGVVTQTAAINVGARLIAFDEDNKITRIEDGGRTMMQELGYRVELGQKITEKMKEDFGAYMAKILFELIEQGPTSPMAKQLMVTPPFVNYMGLKQVQHIVFSGGVSEHVYDRDPKAYGDIGPEVGRNMREHLKKLSKDVVREPIEGIRATVIGAGEYTIQASGNTSYVSNEKALPVHGLKVIQATIRDGESVSEALKQSLRKFDLPRFTSGLALSLTVNGVPDYQSVKRIAEGVAAVLKEADDPKCPLYLTLDLDIAKSLGGILKDELKVSRDIIAVDGIEVGDLDYVDIGECLGITEVIPVTVKSLMFPTSVLD